MLMFNKQNQSNIHNKINRIMLRKQCNAIKYNAVNHLINDLLLHIGDFPVHFISGLHVRCSDPPARKNPG